MNVNHSFLFRTAGLVAGTFFALTVATAAESDELSVGSDNVIKVSAQGTDFNGNRASSQARTQMFRNLSGGIEELRYNSELSKGTSLQIDGKILPGAEDYLAQFKVTKNEVGSLEAGYKRFRTFYDGAGGFFPLNNSWMPIYPRALFVDRGRFFITGTVAMPKQPVFTFRYTNETRSGRKDSTIWGDTDYSGIPNLSNTALMPYSANRKILPAYIELGERHEAWEASMRHSVGATKLSFSVAGNRINNLNSRTVDRYFGELRPFPTIPSTPVVVIPPAISNNSNKGADVQGLKERGLSFMGKVVTPLSDQVNFYAEASHRSGDGDTTGSRLITARIQTLTGVQSQVGAFTPAGRPPYSYTSTGAIDYDVLTGVVGLEAKPSKDLRLTAALKAEDYSSKANATANYVSNMVNQTTGVVTPVPLSGLNESTIDEKVWVPEIEARYTGIKDLALYGSWDYRSSPGDEYAKYTGITTSTAGPVVLSAPVIANASVKEKHHNFTVGTNWTVTREFSLRAEVFSKDHENRFTGTGTSLGSFYILDYDIYGLRLTADVKASPTLSFKTRYVQQRGKAAIAEDGYLAGDSDSTKRYLIGETVDWNPTKSFYLQANLNLVYDTSSTAYPKVGGLANDVLHNADNNYWNGSVVAGFAVDKDTDATLTGTYYKADNYDPTLLATTPYGYSGKTYALYAGVKHKFTPRMLGHAKVGYADSRSDTTGGNANFRGPLAYLAIEYGF